MTSGTTITCTGDLSSGESIDVDGISQIIIESLTTDTGELELEQTADTNDDTTSFTATFDGSSTYGVSNSSGDAIDIDLTAGDGGSHSTTVEGETGFDGHDAGSVGASSLTISDAATLTGETVLSYITTGGEGGTGQESEASVDEDGQGGAGGTGGDGGDQTVSIGSGSITTMTATDGALIYMSSQAGDGGAGGLGTSVGGGSKDVTGGDGSTGGTGGDVSVDLTFTDTATATTEGDSTPTVRVESVAGDGGDGGDAIGSGSTFQTTNGGDGGAGGVGGDVTATLSNVELKTEGDTSSGVFVRSYGGAGGDGGSASGGTSGSGGGGALGGISGEVVVEIQGDVTTTGTDSAGILVHSVGGFAGDGGSSSDTISSYGASTESGGQAGTAQLTLGSDSTVTTSGEGAEGLFVQSLGGGGG
ncbi:MAG: hypothetical protein AcusKO_50820 [Acuticoccus sp.]